MPRDWVPYLIIGVVTVALIAVTVVLSRIAWRRQVRRYLVGLIGRREAVGAALNSIDASLRALALLKVEDIIAFSQSDSEERRAFAEIASRMRMQGAEIAELPLPKSLWRLADALGASATGLSEQAGGVGDSEGDVALDALIAMNLVAVRSALAEADGFIADLSAVYDLSDPSVYGGGLYI